MARIRNIKPDYFRHEGLQDLETAHPGCYIMLTYVALWTQCDANGTFPWKPRLLKLDILPFIPFDLNFTLQTLLQNQYITQFTGPDGATYGHIPTFKKHQRITGKEATEGEKYPKPGASNDPKTPETKPGNNRETTGKQPDAQGEERITGKDNREREGNNAHAHEGEAKANQKTKFETTLKKINTWARGTGDWAPLREYAQSVDYDPDKYGPVADEVKKFVAYWLTHETNPQQLDNDPAAYFIANGRRWLLNAKNMNRRPRKNHHLPPPNAYTPPPNYRPNNNGNTPKSLGELIKS